MNQLARPDPATEAVAELAFGRSFSSCVPLVSYLNDFLIYGVMSPTLKTLGIDHLSVAERILLVEEIWESIAVEEAEIPLTEVQRQDLQRRVAAYEANPKAGSSWEDVKARSLAGEALSLPV